MCVCVFVWSCLGGFLCLFANASMFRYVCLCTFGWIWAFIICLLKCLFQNKLQDKMISNINNISDLKSAMVCSIFCASDLKILEELIMIMIIFRFVCTTHRFLIDYDYVNCSIIQFTWSHFWLIWDNNIILHICI